MFSKLVSLAHIIKSAKLFLEIEELKEANFSHLEIELSWIRKINCQCQICEYS